ncbi:hypothetical protein IQ06DRAFT_129441 [Phaeosphaeriaceae sp. SRC1lsM3a]|nr:hypothetical protein IQ06DRAFT_129441 [Stagonospora sp. SRC1lsM3a]
MSDDQGLRNRYVQVPSSEEPPPPPPKSHTVSTGSRSSKPLPSIPGYQEMKSKGIAENKPLPSPPNGLSLKSLSMWIAGICLWFLAIVVLLPIITERDAMPGFNTWLRRRWF